MLNVGKRIGLGYLFMAALLAAIGTAGLLASERISDALGRITGPVDSTVGAVDKGIRGVLLQMIGVDAALGGGAEKADAQIASGSELAANAFQSIEKAGLVPVGQLDRVRTKMTDFNRVRHALLELHNSYVTHYQDFLTTVQQTKDLLLVIEEQASQALVNMEWNAGIAEGESSGARNSEEWAIVSATSDARLALMTRLFDYRQLLDVPEDPELLQTAEISLGDLKVYIAQLADSESLRGKPVGRGPFASQTFDAALNQLAAANEAQFQVALQTHVDLRRTRQRYGEVADALMEDARQIEDVTRGIVAEQLSAASDSRSSAIWLVSSLILIGLVMAFAAYLTSIRTIAAPLRRVAGRMREIASGDGDLTARLDVNGTDEISDVSRSFNEFADKIHETVSRVSDAIRQLSLSSDQMDAMTNANLDRSSRQQAETAQIATATQEMSHTVSNVADSAQGALDSATRAHSEANSGQSIIEGTLRAIQTLGQQVESASTTIQSLERESDAIGGVIDVIEGIAEQTNLLALNAAIEAARAGDQGRGFSVVADEVRTLANRTQQSTAEILGMVERLQTQAREAARVMSESSKMAQSTVEKGEQTGESLSNIVISVASIQGMNQQIASAAAEQFAVAEDISRSLVRINSDGEEIVTDNHRLSDAARSLSQLSGQLDGLIRHFRI
ncbi:MAG: methyl-accepting chemotaxis protein [Chromatiaceae bacterium]|nr:methyl-accepting chemotaxis protein [Chromatiaceae bacterium]